MGSYWVCHWKKTFRVVGCDGIGGLAYLLFCGAYWSRQPRVFRRLSRSCLNSCISGTRGPNMERKGYESIGCYTYYVTLSYDFDLGFWRSNFQKISIIGIRGWIDMEPKGCESLTSPMTLTLDFQGQIFDDHILGMGRSIGLEWSRCELDTMLYAQWACSWASCMANTLAK